MKALSENHFSVSLCATNSASDMHLRPFSLALLFLCFLTTLTSAGNDPTHLNGDVSINCGASGIYGARNGREWHGDSHPECSPLLQMKGFSTASSVVRGSMAGDDPVPYRTARISRSRFSYAFRVKPGQKIIRLHFNSAPYKGFQRFEDLFDVEAGAFTLLGNFSASLTADALGVGSFVKEFCVNIEESQLLNLIFSPASGRLLDSTYAFINGIEIIFVPPTRSYFHGEKTGVQVVGKSSVYLDKNTAFEIVNPLNVRQDSVSSSVNYVSDMFGTWGTVPKRKANMINNITWRVSVDVGFRYLVRLYFSELGFKMAEAGGLEVHINDMLASTSVDIFRERDDSLTWYRDYTVMMEGNKQEGKIDLRIYLESTDEFREGEGHGPLEGFEVMKLSNPDNSLASPNPVPKPRDSSYQTIKNLIPTLGHRNAIVSSAVAVLCLVNIVIYALPQIWEASGADEENMPSARAERLCRRFTLAEIKLATRNFNDGCLIGRGGFGKVYKGFLHDGQQHVAIKRLKSNSSQGVREFLTEIETLTELQHVNVVSLIGYCKEHREMILVYEFMAGGTLADHLYKFVWNNDKGPSLTWKQRLNICIGVGRGLDYLHTGRLLIHRDVKASNILLDEDFVPKLSDFGLVTHLTKGKLQSYVSTKIKGTRGYLDPDYVTTGRVTRKSDIYAFGVVLLEVLSGRPALNSGVPTDEQILTKWAKETISEGKAEQILASNLRGKISVESLKAFLDVVVSCVHDEPKKRPTMATVVLQLEFALEQQESSKSRLVPSGITSHVDDIHPSNSETNALVSDKQLTLHSTYVQKIQSALKGQTNGQVFSVVSPRGRKNGSRTTDKPPRLWPWAACWTRKKPKALQIRPKALQIRIFSILIKPTDLVFLENEDGLVSLQLIGRGGCGEVYKAALPGSNGTEIAIKKIIRPPRDVMEEDSRLLNGKMRQIRSEILTGGQIRHRNLLHLLAHVPRPDNHCLVYTYMKNGSLLDCLQHVACGRRELDWLARYKIAVGVAAGLEYLHMNCVPPILHRNLKPSNILLDDGMEARIADFGLAKTVPDANTHVTTSNVVGNVGYIAPEYYQTFKFSDKCDVYGLGVVLGALVIGKLPSDDFFQHTDEKGLVKWMRNAMNSEEPKRAIDPTLLGNGYEDQMLLVLKVACFCTLDNPKKRPSSKEARSMLSQIRH